MPFLKLSYGWSHRWVDSVSMGNGPRFVGLVLSLRRVIMPDSVRLRGSPAHPEKWIETYLGGYRSPKKRKGPIISLLVPFFSRPMGFLGRSKLHELSHFKCSAFWALGFFFCLGCLCPWPPQCRGTFYSLIGNFQVIHSLFPPPRGPRSVFG